MSEENICVFERLPVDVLEAIAVQLKPRDLAALSLQNRWLRSEIGISDRWEVYAREWWGAEPAATAVARLYSGDWHRMFLARAAMPPSMPAAADKIAALTEEAKQRGGSPASSRTLHSLFEDVLRALEAVHRAVSQRNELKRSAELRGVREDVGWWLSEHAQAAVGFAAAAVRDLHAGAARVHDAEWRLHALEALRCLGLEQTAHLSVRRRLDAEVGALRRLLVEAPMA